MGNQNNELPLVDNANEITPENHPEMYNELCNGHEEGECGEHE